jgi:hypothetical protein
MSVQYYLKKGVRLKDIKEKGFNVLVGEDAGAYNVVIESKTYYTDKETGRGSWVGDYHGGMHIDENGDIYFTKLEGHTGFGVMWEMHEKLGIDYITDNEVDELIMEADKRGSNEIELNDELFDNYMRGIEENMKKYEDENQN